jgi:hypothetical protein
MKDNPILKILEGLFNTTPEITNKSVEITDDMLDRVCLGISLSLMLQALSEQVETDEYIETVARGQLVRFIRKMDKSYTRDLASIYRGLFSADVNAVLNTYKELFNVDDDTEAFDAALGHLSLWEDEMEQALLLQTDCINEYPV